MKNFLILIAILIPTILITIGLTNKYNDEELYKEISDSEMKKAEMLAKQRPKVLKPYLIEAKSQNRKLTELEYKAFNYFKNTSRK